MTETATAPVVAEPSTAFASPLTLILDEERTGGRNLEEALFLSFTADLGFFEEVALGVTQATGARVTVAGDVSMARNDPRSVRRAGRSYLAGLAYAHGAAFHPKLMVLAGPEHATIALGSGNTTLAGWQANAELWTVLRVDGEQSPTAVPELSAWLRDLPEKVRFSAGVPQALGRVAALLDQLHRDRTPTAPQVRVVSSLRSPIIDQLPQGPVNELAVFAPFYDRRSMALRRLLERFRPGRFALAYQPGLSDLDGPSVAALLKKYDGRVISDNDQRYRHGKLVEWVSEGQRWASGRRRRARRPAAHGPVSPPPHRQQRAAAARCPTRTGRPGDQRGPASLRHRSPGVVSGGSTAGGTGAHRRNPARTGHADGDGSGGCGQPCTPGRSRQRRRTELRQHRVRRRP
ncbi:hypothetical protein [Streptomyces sp. NPDC048641]|uniref:hypothetical protein n=1 Tax=Streptomyces sp. NPDC048641 TaxID=3154825 RepID=UPI0034338357